jgi:hypothetical protein
MGAAYSHGSTLVIQMYCWLKKGSLGIEHILFEKYYFLHDVAIFNEFWGQVIKIIWHIPFRKS